MISALTRARRERAQSEFGNQPADFWKWFKPLLKPIGKPQEQPEPPRASRRQWRRPFFPVEAKRFWRELPEWLRFIVTTAACIHLMLFVLSAYYAYGGQ
jgi:hypothetical protein